MIDKIRAECSHLSSALSLDASNAISFLVLYTDWKIVVGFPHLSLLQLEWMDWLFN